MQAGRRRSQDSVDVFSTASKPALGLSSLLYNSYQE
jgi:hypothetical protein